MTIQTSKAKKRSLIITEILMVVLAIVWFIPIYYLIVTTFKTPQDATNNPLGIPTEFIFKNYIYAWEKMEFPRAFANTLFITVVSVVLILVLGGMAGYALARTKTKLGNGVFLFFIAGLVVPFQMNIVSLFKIVSAIRISDTIKLSNTPYAVILVNVAVNIPQAIFLFKEFIESTIPIDLEQAAAIDGCSIPKRFYLIVLPLLKPVVATVSIIVTLNVWNEFMTPLLFLQTREKDVILQEVSRNIGQFSTDWTAMFPMMMLGVLPLIIFYVIMQRHIVEGVAAGAMKG